MVDFIIHTSQSRSQDMERMTSDFLIRMKPDIIFHRYLEDRCQFVCDLLHDAVNISGYITSNCATCLINRHTKKT
jgi:hypothetical protein